MNSNKLLLIVVLVLTIPTLIMSSNGGVDLVSSLKLEEPFIETEKVNFTTKVNTANGLKVGDTYYNIKIKIPNYKVDAIEGEPILIKFKNTSIELDQIAQKNSDKYTILNNSKITKISIVE